MTTKTRLTHSERTAFLQDGYLVVPGQLTPALVSELLEALDGAHRCDSSESECPPRCPG